LLRKPLIVGSRGGMGRRYAAILKKLDVTPQLVDVGEVAPKDFDSVIIATPTPLHVSHCLQFMTAGVPILCEKPLSTSLKQVDAVCATAEKCGVKLDMVNQYKYCGGDKTPWADLTSYDYYNTGRDGLHWDCISIIALAKAEALIRNDSPIWACILNGQNLRLADMDWAYFRMIERWLNGELDGHGTDYIRFAHRKVQNYIEGHA
jgi:hypothetical protein